MQNSRPMVGRMVWTLNGVNQELFSAVDHGDRLLLPLIVHPLTPCLLSSLGVSVVSFSSVQDLDRFDPLQLVLLMLLLLVVAPLST